MTEEEEEEEEEEGACFADTVTERKGDLTEKKRVKNGARRFRTYLRL